MINMLDIGFNKLLIWKNNLTVSYTPINNTPKNNNMKPNLLMTIILPAFAACQQGKDTSAVLAFAPVRNSGNRCYFVEDIPTPHRFLTEL
jgi:hypothetical protein